MWTLGVLLDATIVRRNPLDPLMYAVGAGILSFSHSPQRGGRAAERIVPPTATTTLIQGLPAPWQNAITKYLPSTAGQAIIGRTKFTPPGHLQAPWVGFALFCAYTAATLITATVILNRRDA